MFYIGCFLMAKSSTVYMFNIVMCSHELPCELLDGTLALFFILYFIFKYTVHCLKYSLCLTFKS